MRATQRASGAGCSTRWIASMPKAGRTGSLSIGGRIVSIFAVLLLAALTRGGSGLERRRLVDGVARLPAEPGAERQHGHAGAAASRVRRTHDHRLRPGGSLRGRRPGHARHGRLRPRAGGTAAVHPRRRGARPVPAHRRPDEPVQGAARPAHRAGAEIPARDRGHVARGQDGGAVGPGLRARRARYPVSPPPRGRSPP